MVHGWEEAMEGREVAMRGPIDHSILHRKGGCRWWGHQCREIGATRGGLIISGGHLTVRWRRAHSGKGAFSLEKMMNSGPFFFFLFFSLSLMQTMEVVKWAGAFGLKEKT